MVFVIAVTVTCFWASVRSQSVSFWQWFGLQFSGPCRSGSQMRHWVQGMSFSVVSSSFMWSRIMNGLVLTYGL